MDAPHWARDAGGCGSTVGADVLAWLERVGEVPLPPYIRRPGGPTRGRPRALPDRRSRACPGAVAAPTAGLHFTPGAARRAARRAGVAHVTLTLHVGPGTFLPIRGGDLDALPHGARALRAAAPTRRTRSRATRAAGGRVVAVGTTTVRALESAAADGPLRAGAGEAGALHRARATAFRVVDALLTNFHLPRTPLLALVAALAGWERVRAAYEEAVRARYRFYSYGDAMLIT